MDDKACQNCGAPLVVRSSQIVQLPADAVRAAAAGAAGLSAVVTYREGEQYGRVTAFAPLARAADAAESSRDSEPPRGEFDVERPDTHPPSP